MLSVHALDDVWIRIECEPGIAKELSDYFTFEAPGARFMRHKIKSYKYWDGRIRLFKLKTHTLYRGLLPRLIEFADQRGYPVTNHVPIATPLPFDLEHWLSKQELPFPPRDYQFEGLRTLLEARRGICLAPTGSGKSFIIYLLTRVLEKAKVLVVVPTIGLVQQMTSDFKSYGCDVDREVHQIQGGREKTGDERIFISTWQSIYELPADYFQQFNCVVVDEVHLAKAKSLMGIMEKCTHTPFRFGFTGTLDDTQAHRLILEGLFGTVTKVASTHDLVKQKQLAPLHVKLCVLKYPEPVRKRMRKTMAQYQDELEYLVQDMARTEFIARTVAQTKGNTLVLFTLIAKQGLYLFERIKAVCPHKTCHYIAGSVEGETREQIRQLVEHGENQVIVASYGTFSLGVNITNLRTLVFASPSKSKYRVLQSVGRTLRMHETKHHATLIDIVDDLRIGKHVNHVFKHAEQRARYYASEKFPVTLYRIDMDAFTHSALESPPAASVTARNDDDLSG